MAQDPLAQLGVPAIPNSPPANVPDPLAALGTPAILQQPDTIHVMGRDWVKHPATPVAPPQDHREEIVKSIAGDFGLSTYRQARDTVGSVETLLKSPSTAYDAAKQAVVARFKPDPNDSNPDINKRRVLGEPIMPGPGVAEALGDYATMNAFAPTGVAPVAVPAAAPTRINPFREILKGKSLAQEPAEAAVRSGVAASATDPAVVAGAQTTPLMEGSKTILDDPLASLAAKEKAAYKAVDDVAGFDLKEAKLELKNDQYKIAQLGNTPADQAARETLTASIQDSTARIAKVEQRLQAAGIDPKAADALHTARMAGTDFKNTLVRATAPDGTINVDRLLNASKILRFSKRGDRLAQFMGKVGADEYMAQLEAAQKVGVHAMKVQNLAKWVGGIVGAGTIAGGAAHVAGLLEAVPTAAP